MQRLSSGMRINNASDDASGLVVSKKIEAQIMGAAMAARNAQDGISMLQTAEGGMKAVGDMLLRMRELAVQAGNGTYTTSDRAELQKEMDQLKQEVDRVTVATEFNTKKLLNGDSTALWSSSSDKVNVIVNSNVQAGDYQLDITTSVGKSAEYSSHIMRIKDGEFAAGINTATSPNQRSIAYVSTLEGQTFGTKGDAYNINVGQHATANGGATTVSTFKAQGTSSNFEMVGSATPADVDRSGYLEVTVGALTDGGTTGATSTIATLNYKFVDAKTGEVLEGTATLVNGAGTATATISLANAAGTATFDITVGLGSLTAGSASDTAVGTKALVAIQSNATADIAALQDGGGAISLSAAGSNAILNVAANNAGRSVTAFYGAGELGLQDNLDGVEDTIDAQYHFTVLNSTTGEVDYGKLQISFNETSNGATGSTAAAGADAQVVVREGGELATATTRLGQLNNFINADGVDVLPGIETLTIYGGNGQQANVYTQNSMTLRDFDVALTQALVTMEMGATQELAGSVSGAGTINNNLVLFDGSTGTLNMRAAILGDESTIATVGGEQLVNAFGFSKHTAEANSIINTTTTNLGTGKVVSTETTSFSRLSNSIEGTTIEVLNAGVSASAAGNVISFTGGNETTTIHLVDNRTNLQIGGNAGQTISVSVAQLDGKALGIESAYVYDQEKAGEAISKIDSALTRVNSSRATVGAQVNRLQYTTTNLDTMRENLISANSRIVDADIAAETTLFTRNQVLQQAATAMLAQANALPQSALTLIR